MSHGKTSSKQESVAVLVFSLTLVSALAAGVLACVSHLTKEPRAAAALKETNAALLKLEPGFDNVPEREKVVVADLNQAADLSLAKWEPLPGPAAGEDKADQVVFYPARKGGELVAVIAKAVSPIGYGGDMTVMASLSPADGAVRSVIVTANNETPGLGDAVFNRGRQLTLWGLFQGSGKEDAKTLPPNRTLDFFNGKKYSPAQAAKWTVRKDGGDFLFVTGATVSSRAVTYGVKRIVACYHDVRPRLAAAFAAAKQPGGD